MNWRELEQAALRDRPDSYSLGPQQPQLKQLMRAPRATIPALIADHRARWRIPIIGFIALSYSEGVDRAVTSFPEWPILGALAMRLLLAGLFGGWLWALMWGGATHLAARVLGGRRGWADTARAMGYALFWPGAFGAMAGTGAALTWSAGGDAASLSLAFLAAQISAGLWAAYTVTAALKVHHEFGWVRAIMAYALPFAVLIGAVVAYAR